MCNERKQDHNEFLIYKPPGNPLPTFFPVFTDTRVQSSDVNEFAAKQFEEVNKGGLKTVISTATPDSAVVPSTFLNRGLLIRKNRREAYDAAWETAINIHSLFKQEKLTRDMRDEILQEYTETHGFCFRPYYTESISHSYPIVTIKSGWMVAKTVAGYPMHYETEIKVVARGFRDYAEIGLDFIEKYHCCFCLLSPKWAQRKTDQYHFFVDASHKDCPFAKKIK